MHENLKKNRQAQIYSKSTLKYEKLIESKRSFTCLFKLKHACTVQCTPQSSTNKISSRTTLCVLQAFYTRCYPYQTKIKYSYANIGV